MDVMIRGRSPPDRKLASSLNTPTTTNGPPRLAPDCDASMISLPSASPSPNRRSLAVVVLITTTRDADRDSCSVKTRPSTMFGGFTAGQLAVTPADLHARQLPVAILGRRAPALLDEHFADGLHPLQRLGFAKRQPGVRAPLAGVAAVVARLEHDGIALHEERRRAGRLELLGHAHVDAVHGGRDHDHHEDADGDAEDREAARTRLARIASSAMLTPSMDIRSRSQRLVMAHSCRRAATGSSSDARLAG